MAIEQQFRWMFIAIFVGLSVLGSTGYLVYYEWRRGRHTGTPGG